MSSKRKKTGKPGVDTGAAMERFLERLRAQIGEEEFRAYLRSCGEEPARGLRANTGKVTAEELEKLLPFAADRVPWCREGFYVPAGSRPALSPFYCAGLYYIQEPSAMLPAALLPAVPGNLVLDLCAAPGGKSTALAAKTGDTGFLVSNDISAARARALVYNLESQGFRNFCVTAEEPARLRAAFGRCFDSILVDAPCSGEGMFRRDPALKKSWAEKDPSFYSPLQAQILREAEGMLKPGGYLLYSTCTFSALENEEVIGAFLEECPWMELIPVPRQDGFAPGIGEGFENCVRLWPHRIRGEGHFAALMRSRPDICPAASGKPFAVRKTYVSDPPACVRDFFGCLSGDRWKEPCFQMIRDAVYILDIQLPEGLRYLRTGLSAGTVKDGRFEPSAALARALRMEEYPLRADLDPGDPSVLRYLRGETLTPAHMVSGAEGFQFPEGSTILVGCGGYPLGWAKAVRGTLRNKYPAGWRMQ